MPANAFTDLRALVTDFSFGNICRAGKIQQMLTAAQQYAIDQFAKGLLALGDDALIDTYHQASDDLRAARAEGSDNLNKAHAQTLATEKAMRDRFPDYRASYKMRYP
jgi:hypothetical protein